MLKIDIFEGIKQTIESALEYNELDKKDFCILQSNPKIIFNPQYVKKGLYYMKILDFRKYTNTSKSFFEGKQYSHDTYNFGVDIEFQTDKKEEDEDYYLSIVRDYFFDFAGSIKLKDDKFNNKYNNNILFLSPIDRYITSFSIGDDNKWKVLPKLTLNFFLYEIREDKGYVAERIDDIKIYTMGV